MAKNDVLNVRDSLKGDTTAFQELVERWYNPILTFLLKHTGNMEDALELTQETFRTVYERLSDLKEPEKFSSWVYKIALNHSRMRLRKRKGHKEQYLDDLTFDNNEQKDKYTSFFMQDTFSPEEQFSRTEMRDIVRCAIERLSSKQREVIILKEYAGLKFTEIADILDTPLSTVKSRMYIGLENLRKEIIKIIGSQV